MKKIVLPLVLIGASSVYALQQAASRSTGSAPDTPAATASLALSRAPLTANPKPAVSMAPVTARLTAVAPSTVDTNVPLAEPPLAPLVDAPLPNLRPAPPSSAQAPLSASRIPAADVAALTSQTLNATARGAAPSIAAPFTGSATPGSVMAAAAGQLRDGSYTGRRYDAYWGTVQVRATVKNGRLQAVDVLDYPSDRRRSQQINQYALPVLQREVVQAQGTNVNIVSGATLTADAYLNSLTSALTQAQ